MGYCFEHDASVQKDVRRIAASLIEEAIACIDDHARDSDVVVRDVRKTCKKLRGLLRLVRPVFDGYKAENAAFRELALLLAPLRDAAVLIKTHDRLMDMDGVDRARYAPIRRRLALRQKLLDRDATSADRKLGDARDRLLAAGARVAAWKLGETGFDAIEHGLHRTYKRARKAMKEAADGRDTDALHEWRKLAKYHGYHTRLMDPVWPAAMQAHRQLADQVNDLLGDHHDLAVFDAALHDQAEDFGEAVDLPALTALIHQRQDALAAEAIALGARLFAEPASVLTRRWRGYWTPWRTGPATADAA